MTANNNQTIMIIVPVPRFIFMAVYHQYLPVVQGGYHSRYGWTNQHTNVSAFPNCVLEELRMAKEVYRVGRTDNMLDTERNLISMESDVLFNHNIIAPMVGTCAVHVYGHQNLVAVSDVFNGKNNEHSSDWDDYLWMGYNDFLLKAEVPITRCLMPDEHGNLFSPPSITSLLDQNYVILPFISKQEIREIYMKVEDSKISDGERAWVSIKDQVTTVWGSGHGYIQQRFRESITPTFKSIIMQELNAAPQISPRKSSDKTSHFGN